MNLPEELPDPVRLALERTPARLLVGRHGPAYPTATWLRLRADHAAARDAVGDSIDLQRDLQQLISTFGLYDVRTLATSRQQYIGRPDFGRRLDQPSRELLTQQAPKDVDFQVILGDGLSARAVISQVPELLPMLEVGARAYGWTWGRPVLVHQCRVGVMNDIGDAIRPEVLVLLVGERPGLATAESLSAYMAFRPRAGHTDADRNLVSNIHANGVLVADAARRVLAWAERMMVLKLSGVAVKETAWPGGPLFLNEIT